MRSGGIPFSFNSDITSPTTFNAPDNQGSFCDGGDRKEYGYHELLVACGAMSVKSFTFKCVASERMSSALPPLPCNMISTCESALNALPAVRIFFLCMISSLNYFSRYPSIHPGGA